MILKDKTILVVDDEPWVLAVIEETFLPLGCRTILAHSGEEALELTQELDDSIDLLVTDVVLPEMKGHELAKQFSKLYPETKILYISGYMRPAISDKELVTRQKAFVQKPFLPKELVRASEKILDRRNSDRELDV